MTKTKEAITPATPDRGGRPSAVASRPRITATELAEYLGLNVATVSRMKTRGVIHTDGKGYYDAKAAVAAVVHYYKDEQSSRTKDSSDASYRFWRAENEKVKNRDWRFDYGRSLASDLLLRLAGALAEMRAGLEDIPGAAKAVSRLRDAVLAVSPDDAALSYELEDGGSTDAAED